MDFANLAAELNTGAILPEGIVIVTLVVVAIADLIVGRSSPLDESSNAERAWIPYVAIAGLLATEVALYYQWDSTTPEAFLGAFNGDALSVVFRGIIALSTAVTILMSIRYVNQSGTALAEFIMILLTATIGAMFLCAANELVTIFISLETLSISSYLLTGYMKRDPRSNEAALKYLLIGASASAVFLYGTSLLYGLSGGETNLEAIAAGLAKGNTGESITLLIALVFAIAGISFKISAVPFHQWTPDVYEGSPHPWSHFYPSVPKPLDLPWPFVF
jgi:NAD(P)H-quinone oxidoreductase subunit 2